MGMNVELYEALKPHIGDEGARLIAQMVTEPEKLATKAAVEELKTDVEELKTDVAVLKTDVAELNHRMELGFTEIRRDFAEFKADMRGWMLGFFVPLWIGVYGTLGAVVVSIIVRGG